MAGSGFVAAALCALLAAAAAQEAACGSGSCSAALPGDDPSMIQVPQQRQPQPQLQQVRQHRSARASNEARRARCLGGRKAGRDYCQAGDHVPCPAAPAGQGEMCAGNQCCRGPAGDPNATFPCPSASPDWDATGKCAVATQEHSCLEGGRAYCQAGDHVRCPGAPTGQGEMCSGNQCCRGPVGSEDMTFPCPSASPDFDANDKCAVTTQEHSCLEGGKEYCQVNDHVRCPEAPTGQGEMCSGNQCCRGPVGAEDMTFPCPSASPDFNATGKCAVTTQENSCLDPCA